uniref:Uncharacterized protein n=1 Tax=Lepeophtheirus salmonis TaxID=72036 RepID=A0A0K2TAE7_LEPSM
MRKSTKSLKKERPSLLFSEIGFRSSSLVS